MTYTSLSAAVGAAANNDTLLVSGTLTNSDATLSGSIPDGLKIVAGRGLRGTLQVTNCPASGAVLDVSDRQGSLLIQGLKLVVPNSCVGVLADANPPNTGGGNPLTVRGVLFTGATATAVFTAIRTVDESDGPFIFRDNVITGRLNPGIELDGDTNAIEASIFRNKITNTGTGGSGSGIVISDIPVGSDVQVKRNCINGGGSTNGIGIGIDLTGGTVGTNGVTIENNTIKNFAAATGVGFAMDNDDDSVVFQKNVVQNNEVGIQVDFSGGVPPGFTPPTITLNNITGDPTTQTGLRYIPDPSQNLDARNNWWGAASGPNDIDNIPAGTDPNQCPEATCTPNGTGLPVDNNTPGPDPDCGTGAGQVRTCPFRTSPVSGAGAGIGC
jgi:hypothetical protein